MFFLNFRIITEGEHTIKYDQKMIKLKRKNNIIKDIDLSLNKIKNKMNVLKRKKMNDQFNKINIIKNILKKAKTHYLNKEYDRTLGTLVLGKTLTENFKLNDWIGSFEKLITKIEMVVK